MKIAYLEFGSFSNLNKKMNNDITLFENNIIELNKFFNNPEIDIYILTDKREDFKEMTLIIKNILIKYNISLILLNFWDDLIEYHPHDLNCFNKYVNIFNIEQYGYNINDNPYGYDSKKNFNPGNLWYRRYINFYLFSEYNKINNINYDLICLTRLFSTKIINLKKIQNFDINCLYFSIDTFFIGNYTNIEKLCNFGKDSLFINNNNSKNKPILLDDKDFLKFTYSIDTYIFNHIFSSEIQILYYIYKNYKNYKNLRFNITKYLNDSNIHNLLYTNDYYISDSSKQLFDNDESNLFIFLSR
jgi:hypothetical protein